jgi:hypothetical protein
MIIEYTLKVESEYHIGTGLEHPGVVDRTLVRRSDETLVIPAEHFRGLVRDACTQIIYWLNQCKDCCPASLKKGPRQNDESLKTCGLNFKHENYLCILCRLFGTTFTPGRYQFFDNITCEKHTRKSTHNRVDPAIGRTPEETYFSFEVGKETEFEGKITCNGNENNDEIGLLLAGLRLIERVGSRSRRGWGQCCVEITAIDGIKENVPEQVDKRIEEYIGLKAKEEVK